MFEIVSAKLTGIPKGPGWAESYDFVPEGAEQKSLRGHLFVVLSTSQVEGHNVETISAGRILISKFKEDYFNDLSVKPFNALKSAVENLAKGFKESWGDVEIAAASVCGDVVYSAAVGGAEVTICREGSIGTILKSVGEETIVSSGFPKKGDVMLIGTKSFYDGASPSVIKAALSAGSPEEAIEIFSPESSGKNTTGNMAAIVLRFSQEQAEYFESPPVANGFSFPQPSFKQKLSNIVDGILKKLPQKQIYVKNEVNDEYSSQSKKLTFSVALILIFVLAVSIGFGIRQKKINDVKNKYQGILQQVQSEIDEAISLSSVSPERSRELFYDASNKLATLESLHIKDPAYDAVRKKIDSSRASILGEFLATPELFLDLGLLSSGFKGDALTVSGGNIFILDKAGKRIVSIAISTKKSKVVAGPGVIEEAFDLASYEDRAFILASDGVYEVDKQKNKVIEKSWEGNVLIKAFAGNIYILDESGNQIYRYAGVGGAFPNKTNWLSASTNADFSGVRQWVIDGAVYALFPNSKILKYSQGSPQNFKISGVTPEIGNTDAIFAGDDTQYIYLLDRAGKRVVVTDKKGTYKAQYISESISASSNIVVSEADKKIILLMGDKLYSVDIKHM